MNRIAEGRGRLKDYIVEFLVAKAMLINSKALMISIYLPLAVYEVKK